jgi:hypothetical protein
MLKLLLIPLFLYFALLVLIFATQTRILFPAGMAGGGAPLPSGAERLIVAIPDRDTLHGVRIPAAVPRAGPRTLILGFGGNAWNAEGAAAYLHQIYPDAEVVAFHYRGYAPSSGAPSAAALVADAPLIHDFAVARVKPARTLAIGFSIGSGVAASLAKTRELTGLILVTPFDSLTAVASGHYPWLPVRALFRHEMKPAEWLRDNPVPVAIIAAERDTLIPAERTDALRRSVDRLAFDRTIAGAGHNDIYDRADFGQAMREAAAALQKAGE